MPLLTTLPRNKWFYFRYVERERERERERGGGRETDRQTDRQSVIGRMEE